MKNKKFLLRLMVLVLLVSSFETIAQKVVGYYPCYRVSTLPPSQIPMDKLTHICHAFAFPDASGTISTSCATGFLDVVPELTTLAHNAGVKVLISLGGYGNDEGFAPMVASETARANFITNLTQFCKDNNYDGCDWDWETPKDDTQKAGLNTVLTELRAHWDSDPSTKDFLITIAIGATNWSGQWFDMTYIASVCDWIGVMTYDYHGSWSNHTGHNSPLYSNTADPDQLSVDKSIREYYHDQRGIPYDKLLLGIPFYGREFPGTSQPFTSYTGTVSDVTYADVTKKTGYTYHWDDVSHVSYMENGSSFLTYNDKPSVIETCNYAKEKNLQGVMIWELGQDIIPVTEESMLTTVANNMINGISVPVVNITSPSSGATFIVGDDINITADASDSDGTITKVEFFVDGTSIGVDNSSPYSIIWSSVSLANHSLTAVANDNDGNHGTSPEVNISITDGTNICDAPQYFAGTTYATGAEVANNNVKYECKVGGWCSSSAAWAYEPGVGAYWTSAWTEIGPCTITDPVLTSITTSPDGTTTIALSETVSFAAHGYDQNGNAMSVPFTWTATGGTINSSGLYTGTTAGTFTVTVFSGTVSASATVIVTDPTPVLTSITTSPDGTTTIALNETVSFAAHGYDQNGNAMSVPLTWTATGGTINSSGLFTGTTIGTFTVTVSSGTVSASATVIVTNTPVLTSIVVSPTNVSIGYGDMQQFTAQGKDQNGNNINATITWSASAGSINSSGLYTGDVAGSHTITAISGSISGSATITVSTPQTLTSIEVSPATATISLNGTQQFTGQGKDQNGNNMGGNFTWTTTGGSVSTLGLFTGTTDGIFTVTATSGAISGMATITVTSPTNYCEAKGNSVQYEWIAGVQIGSLIKTSGADGGYKDNTNEKFSWAPTFKLTPGFASGSYTEHWKIYIDYNKNSDFEDAGEEVFSGSGTGAVSGEIEMLGGMTGTTRLRVVMRYNTAPSACGSFDYGEVEDYTIDFSGDQVLTRIAVSPSSASITINGTQDFDATCFDQNDNWMSLPVTWSVTGGSINSSGVYTGTTAGTFTVSAISGSVSGAATVTVNTEDPVLTSIVVNPDPAIIDLNETQQFTAQGKDQNGNNMNATIDWLANGGSINSSGLFTGSTAGTFTITARSGSVTGTASVTVNDAAPVTYCSLTTTNQNYEWITGVTIGSFTKTSAKENGGYSDFTSSTINLTAGASVNATLTPNNTQYTEYFKVWIDYNKDGDFEDAGEEVLSGSAQGNTTGTISVPSSASGTTRLRVAMQYNAAPSSPCGSYQYGEVEDYTVSISGAKAVLAKSETDVQVLPNPFGNIATIRFNLSETNNVVISLFNGSGILLNTLLNTNLNAGSHEAQLDGSNLPSGQYIYKIQIGKEITSGTLIKE